MLLRGGSSDHGSLSSADRHRPLGKAMGLDYGNLPGLLQGTEDLGLSGTGRL